ncbi:Uncharacterised protein [Mycobacterium tuberculosis]|nr:Uncharacterised protein [Mycobacterium tuberculosis]
MMKLIALRNFKVIQLAKLFHKQLIGLMNNSIMNSTNI